MNEVPRLGFVGLGWIGHARLEAIARSGLATAGAICDPDPDRLERAAAEHPDAAAFARLEDLLERSQRLGLDAVAIATPNALHESQCMAALESGLSVFCQKPLTPNRSAAERVIRCAREKDRLLGVDYTYRHTRCAETLRELVAAGELGEILHVETCFHNAYGPDKAWCYSPALSGGGAFIDLGIHLVDLLVWLLNGPRWTEVRANLYREGAPLADGDGVEDFADVLLEAEQGPRARLAASWKAHVGEECSFLLKILGSGGGALFTNVGGSFYDFELWRYRGRERERLVREGAESLGRASLDWTTRLASSARFDPEVETSLDVAEVIDRSYRPPAALAVASNASISYQAGFLPPSKSTRPR